MLKVCCRQKHRRCYPYLQGSSSDSSSPRDLHLGLGFAIKQLIIELSLFEPAVECAFLKLKHLGVALSQVHLFFSSSFIALNQRILDPMDTSNSAVAMGRQVCDDAQSVAEAGTTAYMSGACSTPGYNRRIPLPMAAYMSDGCSTPTYSWSVPFCESSCIPECDEDMKPAIGMQFKTLDDAEVFYRLYATKVGFDVRVGQSKKVDGIAVWKRFTAIKRERVHQKRRRLQKLWTSVNKTVTEELLGV
ncbi:hypothetical protein EJB05_56947, partial [Eragrostis curvula]